MVIEFWDYSGSDPIALIVKKLIWYKHLTFWLYLGVLSHSNQKPLEVKPRIKFRNLCLMLTFYFAKDRESLFAFIMKLIKVELPTRLPPFKRDSFILV